MPIADITIIPVGTETPSVSSYVAEIHKLLNQYREAGKVRFQLTPMSTIIEGELGDLFEVIQELHEVPFTNGVLRVATNIRIDDRRDKPLRMEEKVARVNSLLE